MVTRAGDGRQPGHRRRYHRGRPRRPRRRTPARSSSAAARSTPRSCCCSPASGRRPTSRRSASTSSPTCPAWARTSRTTSRSTSSTPPSSRSPSAPGSSTGTSRASAPSGCSCARGVGASNHFEAGGFIRSNDEVAYPNLMFHFLPIAIRYDGSQPAAEHGYQVHIGPMYSDVRGQRDAEVARPLRAPGAAVQLPLDRERPARVDRDGPCRPRHPQPAGLRRLQRRRDLARAVGRDRPGDPRLGRQGRRDRAPPLLHGQDGHGRGRRARPDDHEGARRRGAARRRRLGDALRHQRQHLRPGDDARREGRRPDPRQHARCPRSTSRSTGTATDMPLQPPTTGGNP